MTGSRDNCPLDIPAWEVGLEPVEPLDPLSGHHRTQVCVIGLGGSGLAAILRLLEAGLDVTGIDAGQVAGGAAGRNGGLLLAGTAAFHHDAVTELGETAALEWYRATQAEIQRMLAETPAHVRRTGSLRIAASARELSDCHRQYQVMKDHGLPVEEWDGPEGQGLMFPEDAVFNPLARVRALAAEAVAGGARLFGHSPCVINSDGVISTPSGTVTAERIIVAVDGGLAAILPELKDDVRPLRLQMLGTEPVDGVLFERPVYRRDGFEYWQQLPDGRLLLGGFRDRGGEQEWSAPAEPAEPVQTLLEEFLRTQLGVRAAITHRWAAVVGYRDGILPYWGQPRPGVWAVGGYNGTGNVMGALLARRLASEVIAAG